MVLIANTLLRRVEFGIWLSNTTDKFEISLGCASWDFKFVSGVWAKFQIPFSAEACLLLTPRHLWNLTKICGVWLQICGVWAKHHRFWKICGVWIKHHRFWIKFHRFWVDDLGGVWQLKIIVFYQRSFAIWIPWTVAFPCLTQPASKPFNFNQNHPESIFFSLSKYLKIIFGIKWELNCDQLKNETVAFPSLTHPASKPFNWHQHHPEKLIVMWILDTWCHQNIVKVSSTFGIRVLWKMIFKQWHLDHLF